MTKTFILILFIKAGYAGGLATPEFYTEEACKAALAEVVEEMDGLIHRVSGVCVEKY